MDRTRSMALLVLLSALSCAGGTTVPTNVPADETKTPPDLAESSRTPTVIPVTVRAAMLRAEDRRVVDDALREACEDPRAEVRALATRALGRIADRSEAALVRQRLADPDERVRAEAAYALGLLLDPEAVPLLVEAAGDPSARVRSRVADALGLQPHPRAEQALLSLMRDAEPAVSAAACLASARQKPADFAVDDLIRLVDEGGPTRSLTALHSLALLSSRPVALTPRTKIRARSFLHGLRESRSPEVRLLVALGLGTPVSPEMAEALGDMLKDPDSLVRSQAVAGLGFPAAPLEPFVSLAMEDPNDRVALATVQALSRMRGPEILNALATIVVRDRRLWLRREAILAMEEADPDGAAATVAGLSRSEEPQLRAAAALLLRGRTDGPSIQAATRLLLDEEPEVRVAAIPGLAGAGPLLSEMLGEQAAADDAATVAAVATAAGLRLSDGARSPADRSDAMRLLETAWERARESGRLAPALAAVEAAGRAGRDDRARALLEQALSHADFLVRNRAAQQLRSVYETVTSTRPATDLPLDHYEKILRWAEQPRAARVTVERPGFLPGAFTIRLDTDRAPVTCWRFARLAEEGFYDGKEIRRVIPEQLVQFGSRGAERDGGPVSSLRDEISPYAFPPGTVGMVNHGRDSASGPWFVTLTPQPDYSGRVTPFGRVIRNFPGVTALLLPGDRIVSVEVYEGDGSEPVPQEF